MCWLLVYAWLRVKIKAESTGVRSVLRGGWIIEEGNFLCAGYASKLRLRVPVFVFVTSSNDLRKGSLQTKLNAGLSEQQ